MASYSAEDLPEVVALTRRMRAEQARLSVAHFLNCIVIPSSPEPRMFADVADDWQREMLAPKLPAFEHLAGRNPDYKGPLRFMTVLARGHNKSSLEAWISTALVYSSERHIHGYILAADRDQGRLILQAQEDLLRLNDWLQPYVSVTKDTITGPCGEVTVLPCDASSSMGLRGNLYILDEFVHWKRQKEWTALVTGMNKVRPAVCVALSNAGLEGSWQHDAFLSAQRSPKTWKVFHKPGTLATWLDKAAIEEDKLLIPPSEADRLYENKWIDPAAEHDYLRRAEVEDCEKLGQRLGLELRVRRRVGVDNYVAAIDYGPKRDRTVLVVLHLAPDGLVVIDRLDVWQGCDYPGLTVPVAAVEKWITDVRRQFNPVAWVLDSYQMEGTLQWMQREGMPAEPFNSRGGQGNYALAQHLRAIVAERRLVWYPGAGNIQVADKRTGTTRTETLVDELVALRVKRMPYGYRFDHENQKHDDRAVAIGMASLKAVQFAPPPKVQLPPPRPLAGVTREATADR